MDANSSAAPAAPATGLPAGPEPRPAPWVPLAVALLLALPCLRIPQQPLTAGLDDSWGGVLIHAHQQGWQFGDDLAFTYGPLGLFSAWGFSPDSAVARLVFEVPLAYGIAAGLCLLAWRMPVGWRVAMLGTFLLVSLPNHWGGDDLLCDLGLLFWGLLCWLESGRMLWLCGVCLAALAAVCALTKFSLLVVAGLTIAALVGDLALRGRWRLAAGVLAGFLLGWLGGWVLLGQRWSNLAPFLQHALTLASGYDDAMSLDQFHWSGGLVLALTALVAVTLRTLAGGPPCVGEMRLRRVILLAWFSGLVFLQWKYGFIHADGNHVCCTLAFMPMLALAPAAMPPAPRRVRLWEQAAVAGCVALAVGLLHVLVPGYLLKVCQGTPGNLARNVAALLHPGRYVRQQTAAYQAERDRNQMPRSRGIIGRATVDVFGQYQMFALFNDFNYRPRPVFQSYAAYNRQLMELNDRFYLSPKAPEYVLIHLGALDGRFPPLEDAWVLRDLLYNYGLTVQDGDFLLLHRRPAGGAALTLIREGDVAAGETIGLGDQGGTNLWLEIDLRANVAGRLRRALYKPPEVRLGVWVAPEKSHGSIFRAPACMLSAGFLASPLVLENSDLLDFYQGKPALRPQAFSVELPPDTGQFWRPNIHFRLYRIDAPAPG